MSKDFAIIQAGDGAAEMTIDLAAFERLTASGGAMKPSTAHDVDALASTLKPVFVALAYERHDDGTMTSSILSIFDVDPAGNPTLQTLTRLVVGAPDGRGYREPAREYFRS